MKPIRIREATIQDSLQLMPLMEQLGYPLSLEDMENRVSIYTTLQAFKLFVSVDPQKVMGLIALSIRELIVHPSKKMAIEGLVVDEAYRRQGIAAELMKRAEDYAQEQGCSVIELTSGMRRLSSGAHNFYKKLGYANEGPKAKVYFRKEI